MKIPFCPHEERIAGLLNENRLDSDPSLLDHARKCTRCSEVLFAVEMLQRGRIPNLISAHTGSPGYLWWRAQLRRQNGVVEKITKPVVWAERFALIGMLCIAATFVFSQWGQFRDWFSRLAAIGSENSFMAIAMLAGLLVITCIGGLALYILAADER